MSETAIFILTLIVMASAMLAYILHTESRIKRLEEKRKRKKGKDPLKAYIEQLEQALFQIIEARNLHATVDTALARRIDELTQEDEIMQGFSKWKDEGGNRDGR